MPATTKTLQEDRSDLRHRLTGADTPLEDRINRGPGEDLTPPRERAALEGTGPRTRAQIFAEMDPQEWACRSQEHSWPQLVPGADKLPPGMHVSAAGQGNVLFEEDCLHGCGRFRETLTQRGFVIIWRRYGTRPGHRHVTVHRNESMTKAEMREDTFSSSRKLIQAAVRESKAVAREAVKVAKEAAKAAKS